ncbi:MAG: glycerophosphodiester phosphodiesterase, partial [Candidatus Saccharibacteria bacterium]|nr:glycerophosphodiester phosphodiesterase [Moraxellaceae bacterium]
MKLIGHRGARGEAPENTLGGFQHIIDLGLKSVEFDVRLLADGKLAVLHDASLQRTAGKLDLLSNLRESELTHFDNRQGWADWKQSEPIPTLQQTLDLLVHFEHIEVEVKAVEDQEAVLKIADQLLVELNNWSNVAAVTVTSFDVRILAALQQSRGEHRHLLKTGLLLEPLTDSNDVSKNQTPVQQAIELGCSRIGLSDKLATESSILAIKNAGLAISIWTVNSPERAKELEKWHVDGLITDRPTL